MHAETNTIFKHVEIDRAALIGLVSATQAQKILDESRRYAGLLKANLSAPE
jgi:hypothetical protein